MDEILRTIRSSIKRVETHPLIRSLYRFDLLEIPQPLSRFVKVPIAIVQPQSDDEVLKVLEVAEKYDVPIVPRGMATSAYGGAVPLRDSIVVDFTRMRSVEVRNASLIAESGVVWMDAERESKKHGSALRVYPTSAPASTVGGWISQNGYGVGSLRYGSIRENVKWLEVADFDGIRRVEGDELKYYVGAYGTTGLIVRACIALRRDDPILPYAEMKSIDKAIDAIEDAYHAAFMSSGIMKRFGFGSGDTLLVCYEGEGEENDLGRLLWDRRFAQLAAAKNKPVLSEAVVPLESIADVVMEISRFCEFFEIFFARNEATIFAMFDWGYSSIFKALKLIKIAEKFGGRVYGSGMLFPHKEDREDVRAYKQRVDPKNLLNPGKVWQNNPISIAIRIAEMVT